MTWKAAEFAHQRNFLFSQGKPAGSGLSDSDIVRLTGCPLRCGYCDAEYAFYGGKRLS